MWDMQLSRGLIKLCRSNKTQKFNNPKVTKKHPKTDHYHERIYKYPDEQPGNEKKLRWTLPIKKTDLRLPRI